MLSNAVSHVDRPYLLFALNDERFAISTPAVVEVLQALRPLPIPGAAAIVDGVVSYRGTPLPVFSLRRCFELEDRPVRASDHLIVIRFRGRLAAARVDRALGLEAIPGSAFTSSERLTARTGRAVSGVARLPDGLVFISDADAFLSEAEASALERAMEGHAR